MTRVLVMGGSGIIGQHMRLCAPQGVRAIYCRRTPDGLHESGDMTNGPVRREALESFRPDVVVNLAGENSPDAVEVDPPASRAANVELPIALAEWCERSGAFYMHVSTQGVFGGDSPPYSPSAKCEPANEYGRQKLEAESAVRGSGCRWVIVRPTFVLGVRPIQHGARQNPLEAILAETQPRQVCDRWFSTLFARDAGELLWEVIGRRPHHQTFHLGNPVRFSRQSIAEHLGVRSEPVPHESFVGFAPRPVDTSYAPGSLWRRTVARGLEQCRQDFRSRASLDARHRGREIAFFLGKDETYSCERLLRGFHAAHAEVAADFRRANPCDDQALLDWYRTTESYIWELSAYHCESGFNYAGMCSGIAERLAAAGARRVVCLGDGIGDLTLALALKGLEPVYHDLAGSRTACFAEFRFRALLGRTPELVETSDWSAAPLRAAGPYDAVVSLDFLEHVTDVEAWACAIRDVLQPGGWLMAQNAFGIGSGPDGSIPCHLSRNDRYETEWGGLMRSLQMAAEGSNWWRKI